MTAEFSLAALVREVLDEDTSEDLAVILKEARARIPAERIADALDQALAPLIHQVISTRRTSSGRPAGPSRKVAAIRDHWRRYLDEIQYTVADGSIRRIGNMTAGDLVFVASHLEDAARKNRAKALRAKAIAAALAEHNVTTVRELPDSYLESALGDWR